MSHFLEALNDGRIKAVTGEEAVREFLGRLKGAPLFACVVGSTDTALIEGISAAGATAEKRRFTAALDSEFLVYGTPVTLPEIPKNPLGPPSPVVITQAALHEMGIAPVIVDSGSDVPPATPLYSLGFKPGKDIRTGKALSLPEDFGKKARALGRALAGQKEWLILSESVPGGTTTALSLLEALGFRARGKVSSSMPGGNHSQKEEVVAQALASAKLGPKSTALDAACAVGDPMQPLVAFMALEASLKGPVVLGGGTQMASVWALIHRLWEEGEECDINNIGLATTKWVAADPAADLAGILLQAKKEIPAVAAWLDFAPSRHAGLRRYEEGLVKEGVGAGAAAFAAFGVTNISNEKLLRKIEDITEGVNG